MSTYIGGNAVLVSFVWNFGTLVGNPVLAYPSITYGASSGLRASNTNLPKAINQVKSLVVNWDYSLTYGAVSDGGNVLIDIWLISTPNHLTQAPNGYNSSLDVVVALIIFLDNRGINRATYYLKWTIVNGQRYYFYGGIESKGIYAISFPLSQSQAP